MSIFKFNGGSWDLSKKTYIMGILNITPDSFSDGGKFFDEEKAITHAIEMQASGADIIDIGGKSTRPGHAPLSPQQEWERISSVLKVLIKKLDIPISVDTDNLFVAQKALKNGVAVINDQSGDLSNGVMQQVLKHNAAHIVMHAGKGSDYTSDSDAFNEVVSFFNKAVSLANNLGFSNQSLCLDPGIGFSKSSQGNLSLFAKMPQLVEMFSDYAILVGASRKRIIQQVTGQEVASQRLGGTIALHTIAQYGGARILRVHDVAQASQAAAMVDSIINLKG